MSQVPNRGVATGVIDALRGMPLVLALVTISIALIVLLYYQATMHDAQRRENVKQVLEIQTEMQKLLSQCAVAPPPRSPP